MAFTENVRLERPVPETTVLVIEDEDTLRKALAYVLGNEGWHVETAATGEDGLDLARHVKPDLVILDLMLPTMNGFDVCRTLRRESAMPILILTAKTDEVDKVVGLEIGADDYMTKPFSMRELVARVRSLLRRARMAERASNAVPPAQVLESGDLHLDLHGHRARKGGVALRLKPREFDLLALLMANKGRAFSREQILEQLGGPNYIGDVRTVDVHIRWLREKIEADASDPMRIVTVRGVGYRFDG